MIQNELQNPQGQVGGPQQNSSPDFMNGVPVMTHPTVNGNVKHSTNNPGLGRPGYQVFRSAQPQENLEVWLHGPR